VQPAGDHGYFQRVDLVSRELDWEKSSLALLRDGQSEPLQLGPDAMISTRIDPAPQVEAPLVFAGYGLKIKEAGYDDFAGIDLRGKIAVILDGRPERLPGALTAHFGSTAERSKALREAGAIGSLRLLNSDSMETPWERQVANARTPSMSLADPVFNETEGLQLSVTISPKVAPRLFAGSGHTLDELLALAKEGKQLPRFPLAYSLRARTKVKRGKAQSMNVVGLVPGSDPKLKNEVVVLSAHLDGYGVGRPVDGDAIYNGALDNAAGAATLLDIAAHLHASKSRLRRSVALVFVTAEERGLLGSRYFAARPTLPQTIVANINSDMYLPLYPLRRITMYGLGESDLEADVREAADKLRITVAADPEPKRNAFIRSDQYSFIREGVPALALSFGYEPGNADAQAKWKWLRERYHSPKDDLNQPIDLQAAADYNQLMLLITESVADRDSRPQWNQNSFFRRFAKGSAAGAH
jgi:Zn-dependent M28 family amino/carboxypeptidase